MTSGLGVAGMAAVCARLCFSVADLNEQGLVFGLVEENWKHMLYKLQPGSSSYCNPGAEGG